MKHIIIMAVFLFNIVLIANAQTNIERYGGSKFKQKSSANTFGAGSPYKANSINNPYGAGSPYKTDSPNNPYGKGMKIVGE